jgi:hypothetical protein
MGGDKSEDDLDDSTERVDSAPVPVTTTPTNESPVCIPKGRRAAADGVYSVLMSTTQLTSDR